jgi:peptidoglycan/xylan/chitin deacetylase (PgdA/CDA1 family)
MIPSHWVTRVRHTAHRFWNSHRYRPVILLYHRIAECASPDPFALCVTPRHFAEHLEVLKSHGPVISLRQLSDDLHRKRLPRRAVAITFDDGYADNLHQAKPLLDRYAMPATLFVASGYLGGAREFWWDELERLVLGTDRLPAALNLTVAGRAYEWQFDHVAEDGDEEYRRRCAWRVGRDQAGPRERAFQALYDLANALPSDSRDELVDQVRRWRGASSEPRSTHRQLSIDELRQLADGGIVDVGAHTVRHPRLAALSLPDQRAEIAASKTALEGILGRAISSFSYPFGWRHYTAETAAIVRQIGFDVACSTFTTAVSLRSDPLELPRLTVQDWDGDAFGRRLRECALA